MLASADVPQSAARQGSPPASWWVGTALLLPALNFFVLWGAVAVIESLPAAYEHAWWVFAAAIVGVEFAGFDVWGRRIGLGRGWAIFGTIVAVALGALVSIAVIYVYLLGCNCFE